MRPEPAALRVAQASSALTGAVVLLLALAAAFAIPALDEWRWWFCGLAVLTVIVTLAEVLVLEPRSARTIRYELRDQHLELNSGALVRSSRFVPYRQVLVVERRSGPLLRWRGLVTARLRLPEGQVDVVGVSPEAFEAIRERVMLRADDDRDATGEE